MFIGDLVIKNYEKKSTKISTNRRMDKKNIIHIYIRIIL